MLTLGMPGNGEGRVTAVQRKSGVNILTEMDCLVGINKKTSVLGSLRGKLPWELGIGMGST